MTECSSFTPDADKIHTSSQEARLSCIAHFKKQISPILLKHGLTLSHNLKNCIPNLYWTADSICLVPTSQQLISFEVYDDYYRQTEAAAECNWNQVRLTDDEEKNLNLRLDLLQCYLLEKKVLFPSGKWNDCFRWKDNLYFTMWLRREFLLAKYYDGAHAQNVLKDHPELNARESIRKVPPSSDVVNKAFGMSGWSRKLDFDASYARMRELVLKVGGKVISPMYGPTIDDDFDISHISLEDILDMLGYQVYDSGLFNIFCEELNIWPFWTKEYIDALATYLLERTFHNNKQTLILEVGAGDGMLSLFIREAFSRIALQQNYPNRIPEVIATDDGSWKINHGGDVEHLNAQQAMTKYADQEDVQLIVISSWMPNGYDWTYLFRQKEVYEYILIGETDYGNCAHNWYTWGNPDYNDYFRNREANDQGIEAYTVMPPYQADGYQRVDLDHLSELQYARFDTSKSRCSSTVSFRNYNCN